MSFILFFLQAKAIKRSKALQRPLHMTRMYGSMASGQSEARSEVESIFIGCVPRTRWDYKCVSLLWVGI